MSSLLLSQFLEIKSFRYSIENLPEISELCVFAIAAVLAPRGPGLTFSHLKKLSGDELLAACRRIEINRATEIDDMI